MKHDLALETARDFLQGTICECGHTESEHHVDLSQPYCVAGCAEECACAEYRPVKFEVKRAAALR